MSYLVLARKWRPTTFKELVGQQHVVQTLSNAISTGRVHHAFLFTGCRGVGKTSAARILAKALNCEQGLSVDPCGQCTNCQEIAAGSSPDVYEIDGASNTSVDNIRELRESVRYLPAKSRYKIYIIDEVHMLSTSAFNALLKTLEEPPPHVKFIFATTEPQKIPITILSRCQRFDFRRVTGNEMLARLREMMDAENINIDNNALRVIIRGAQGSMRDAQSLLEQAIAFCGDDLSEQKVIEAIGAVDRHYVEEALQGIVRKEPARALAAINYVYSAGHDLVDFTGLLAGLLRDLAVVSAGLDANLLERSESELAIMQDLAQQASPIDIQRYFTFISNTARDLRTASIPKLILDMAVLRCCAIEHTHNLGAILNEMRNIYAGAPVKPAIPADYRFSNPVTANKDPQPSPETMPVSQAPLPQVPTAAPPMSTAAKPQPEVPGPVSSQQAPAVQKETPAVTTPVPPTTQQPVAAMTKATVTQPTKQKDFVPEAPKAKEAAPTAAIDDEEPPLPDDSYAGANYDEAELLSPPEEPPVPTQPTGLDNRPPVQGAPVNEDWATFVTQMNNIDPTLGPVLEHAYLVTFGPGLIQVSFKGNDFYRGFLAKRESQEKATAFASNFFRTATKIEIVDHTDDHTMAPLCEQQSAKEQNRLRERHQQAENDPRVKAALQILDGSLTSIKML